MDRLSLSIPMERIIITTTATEDTRTKIPDTSIPSAQKPHSTFCPAESHYFTIETVNGAVELYAHNHDIRCVSGPRSSTSTSSIGIADDRYRFCPACELLYQFSSQLRYCPFCEHKLAAGTV